MASPIFERFLPFSKIQVIPRFASTTSDHLPGINSLSDHFPRPNRRVRCITEETIHPRPAGVLLRCVFLSHSSHTLQKFTLTKFTGEEDINTVRIVNFENAFVIISGFCYF